MHNLDTVKTVDMLPMAHLVYICNCAERPNLVWLLTYYCSPSVWSVRTMTVPISTTLPSNQPTRQILPHKLFYPIFNYSLIETDQGNEVMVMLLDLFAAFDIV